MSPTAAGGAAERKFVSVLFADLTGFTAMCESLDPEDVHEFLLPAMTALRRTVESHGGSVVQVSGDGFLAVFGAPAAQEDHAERAVRASLALRDRVRELNAASPGVHVPEVHAGVNAGEVFVAPSDDRTGFTVFGDVVNVASRLCSLAPSGGVLVGASVRSLSSHAIVFGPVRSRRIRGRREPVAVSEALRPRGRVPGGRTPVREPAVFVGRDDALEALAAECAAADRERRSRVLIVTGDAGIGKSRLSSEFRRRMSGAEILAGRCSPYGQRLPLSALASAIASRAGVVAGGRRGAASLTRFAHGIAPAGESRALARRLQGLVGLEDPDAAGTSVRESVAAARSVVEALAARAPVVVLLDDLHWADPDLLDLLQAAAESPWSGPIVFAGLSRPELPRAVESLPRLRLGALPENEMRRLLLHRVGPGFPPRVAEDLVRRAGGNPLFLEESVQMLLESGAIDAGPDGRFRVADPAALANVPATLHALIAARIDGLDGRSKRTLQLAAIAGRVCWDRLLDDVEPGAAAPLSRLESADLLRRRAPSSIPGSEEFEFKHPLIRDVAEQSVPRSERALVHAGVADWLTKQSSGLGEEPVPLIAHHAEAAWLSMRPEALGRAAAAARAAEWLLRWGDLALRHQARLADSVYDRALAAASSSGEADAATTAAILAGRAECAKEQGRHAQARADAQRASVLARRAGRADLEARALLTEGGSLSDTGDVAPARLKLERARRTFHRAGDLRGEALALRRLAGTRRLDEFRRCTQMLRSSHRLLRTAGDAHGLAQTAEDLAYVLSPFGGTEFRERFEEAKRLARDDADLRLRAGLLRIAAYDALYRGRPAEAIEHARAAKPIAEQAGALAVEADAGLVEALALSAAGDPAAAAAAEDVVAFAKRLQSSGLRALGLLAGARPALRADRPADAAARIRSARRILARQPVQLFEADLTEATVACDRGAWRAVGPVAATASKRIVALGVRMYAPLAPLAAGRAALGSGSPAQAVRLLTRAAGSAHAAGAPGVHALAAACLDQAAVLAGGRSSAGGRRAPRGGLPETAAVRAETQGIEALARGRRSDAAHSFALAVRLWTPLGTSAWLARALVLQAQAGRGAARRKAAEMLDLLALGPKERVLVENPLP